MTSIGHAKTTCVSCYCHDCNYNVIEIKYRIGILINSVFPDNDEFNIIFQFLITPISGEYVFITLHYTSLLFYVKMDDNFQARLKQKPK